MFEKVTRSPFFYVGDKYKLMPQLRKLMPDDIDTYIEPFVGGGSSLINTKAKRYIANDKDKYVIALHKLLSRYSDKTQEFVDELLGIISDYSMSCSYAGVTVPDDLKKKYVKTYYSKFNKVGYEKMRADYNKDQSNELLLYLLLIYGFNHMIRFNLSGDFNLPVGNVDFNKNVFNAIVGYLEFSIHNKIKFHNKDYKDFLSEIEFSEKSYVYFDPPYLISMSEYNKLWSIEDEKALYLIIDELNAKGVRFGITNLINHKGKENTIFSEWAMKYKVYDINSNYISFNDNTIKKASSKTRL